MGEKDSEQTGIKDKSGAESGGNAGSVEGTLTESENRPKLAEGGEKALNEAEKIPQISERETVEKMHAREMDSLKKVLEQKEGIIHDYENLLKKIQADFDNYRKRIEREREEYTKFVNERIVRKLLTIVDDLDRGLADSKGNGGYDAFKQGIEKIRDNTMQLLLEEGLKEIPTKGKFDPYFHEALVVEENPDYEDNEIVEVYQKGFTLGGKVLRPSKVRVSRNPPKKDHEDQEKSDV